MNLGFDSFSLRKWNIFTTRDLTQQGHWRFSKNRLCYNLQMQINLRKLHGLINSGENDSVKNTCQFGKNFSEGKNIQQPDFKAEGLGNKHFSSNSLTAKVCWNPPQALSVLEVVRKYTFRKTRQSTCILTSKGSEEKGRHCPLSAVTATKELSLIRFPVKMHCPFPLLIHIMSDPPWASSYVIEKHWSHDLPVTLPHPVHSILIRKSWRKNGFFFKKKGF